MQEPRHRDRLPLLMVALWYDRDGLARRGVVCDLTERGMFIKPVGALPDGIEEGFATRVVLMTGQGGTGGRVELTGTVRWAGTSFKHRCNGIGIEFESTPATLSALLASRPPVFTEVAAAR